MAIVRSKRSKSSAIDELESFFDDNEDMIPAKLHDDIAAIFETVDDEVEELETEIEDLRIRLGEVE